MYLNEYVLVYLNNLNKIYIVCVKKSSTFHIAELYHLISIYIFISIKIYFIKLLPT
jgi:hypothetical protein